MFSKNLSKVVIAFLSGVFASHIAYKIFRKKNQRREIHEVIMFSSNDCDAAELKRSKFSRCMISESMDRLLYYLHSPRQSIDICMYVMTNVDLINAILKLHIRGIQIRVILDADMAFSSGSAMGRLAKHKIPVRWMKSTNFMHHKFCLIDTRTEDVRYTPVVILGSLNWTNQALSGNWEDVGVTSQRQFVEQYKIEFERMWLQFKPIVDMS
ncbi:mitochondrial cardiolipin hydrolase-like [Maniola hyperantus]|uniref:mitochondrial cardiolipin hydrolase-like n=1 Tax=Aphantopus hyperantus TaxID=2795564 RepID=UPI00156A7116|nr:mitochondrial cardiolipin hydrolase-like [Maniola hyperantus]